MTAPVFSADDTLTVNADNNCQATVSYNYNDTRVNDNCAPYANLSISNNRSAGGSDISGVYPLGDTEVIVTAIDPSGNSAMDTIVVRVEDNTPPIAACVGGLPSIALPPSDTLVITYNFINNNSSDNCSVLGAANFSLSRDTFSCIDAGQQFDVTLTVTDDSGNFASCNTRLEIQDNTSPVAVCQDITVNLDSNGTGSIMATDLDGGSTDNCTGTVMGTGQLSFAASQTVFSSADVGLVLDTLTVTDTRGNSSTCVSNVTVDVPETCFDAVDGMGMGEGVVEGGAATIIDVPIIVENFINVEAFPVCGDH